MTELLRAKTNTERYTSDILPNSASAAISGLSEADLTLLDPSGVTPLVCEYTNVLANMEIQMTSAFDKLTPEEAQLVTAAIHHSTIKQRCEVAGIDRKKYDALMKTPQVARAIGLIAAYSITQSGGTRAARKLMLQDIARKNIESDPRVTIAANNAITQMEDTEQAFILAREQATQAQQSGGVLFNFKLT